MGTNKPTLSTVLTITVGVFVYLSIITNFLNFLRSSIAAPSQRLWIEIYSLGDPKVIYATGAVIIPFLVYYGLGLTFLIVDLTGRPSWVLKYKVQDPTASYPIPADRVKSVMKMVIFNQLCVQVPVALLSIFCLTTPDVFEKSRQLPTIFYFFKDFLGFVIVEEIMFYYGHRLLHHPRIYKYIHKKHHEWQSPFALTAVYCHPFEHFLSNLLPVAVGPLLMKSHILTSWIWFVVASTTAITSHSGYHMPFLPSPEAHDYHHLK